MKYRVTIKKEGVPDEERVMEADSHFGLYDQVRNEGGLVVAIKEQSSFGQISLSKFNITIGTGIKRMEVVRTAKNLSAMLSAGLSISRALSVIERQSSNKNLKAIAAGLSLSIRNGSSFHEALALYPKVFPELFIAMVRAGEESGSLTQALNTIALQMERSEELVRKIKGAMIYPIIVISAVVLVAVLMLIFVVPTLITTFASLHVTLPLATRVIVAISNFMTSNVTVVLVGFSVLIVGGIMFARSKIGGNIILSGALHFPVIGELVRETYTARAARTLSSLLSAGVPVLESLSITKEVVHADIFAKVIGEAEENVRKGGLLSTSFSEHSELYPILMSDMLAVGEETGKVSEMLGQISEIYEADVAEKTKDLSTIIEPVLMLVIGAGVGVFAVAIISPIYSLSSAI